MHRTGFGGGTSMRPGWRRRAKAAETAARIGCEDHRVGFEDSAHPHASSELAAVLPWERMSERVFYRNDDLPTYEDRRRVAAHTAEDKMSILGEELDRYAV